MRFFYLSEKYIKLSGLIGLMVFASLLLSGCAGMMHQLGYVPIEKPETKVCANAPVLITNLSVDARHRKYQLPDGQVCSGVNYYEEDQLQSKRAAALGNL